jgi:hypothetical protein
MKRFLKNWLVTFLQTNQQIEPKCTVSGQIKLGHLKFSLCKSDHSIVNIFVSVYIICPKLTYL